LWGTSIGGKETLKSEQTLPEEAYPSQIEKQGEETITIGFEKGEICSLNGEKSSDKIALINKLESIASKFGIGREMHIGDTIIGIKGRVGIEAVHLCLLSMHTKCSKNTHLPNGNNIGR
jgi:argininosuccinate synthase